MTSKYVKQKQNEIVLLCTSSNERMIVCEIVGCFNCEQAQFLSTPMLEIGEPKRGQGPQKLWEKYGGYA